MDGYTQEDSIFCVLIGLATLLATITTTYILTRKKAKKNGTQLWDQSSKNALERLLIHLLTGGIFCVAMMHLGMLGLITPLTLIFYDLALISASNFSYSIIKQLGIVEIVLGIVNLFFIGYGLYFWALGFGVLHIVYGTYVYLKFERV